MEFDSADRISELPDSLIHSILFCLSRQDAARISVLSKRWNHLWETFPDLSFDQRTYTKVLKVPDMVERTPEATRRVGEFLDIVKRSLLRSARLDVRGIKFCLNTAIVEPELCSKVDECFKLALTSCAVDIGVWNWAFREDVVPEIVFLSNPFRYQCLQILGLWGVRLSEEAMGAIFLSCPNMCSLFLMGIEGLVKLDIQKLYRLDVVRIFRVKHLSVCTLDTPKLREFHFTGHQNCSCTLNLASCAGLRELSLEETGTTDEFLRSLTTLCPLLQRLSVTDCKMPRKVRISAKCLTSLNLRYRGGIEVVEIDAPTLLSLCLDENALPRLLFKSMPLNLEIIHPLPRRADSSHFVNLRKLIATSSPIDRLTVAVSSCQGPNLFFCHKMLRQVAVPPVFQLDHLKLDLPYAYPCFDEQALLDGLLWSFHPKKISMLFWYSKTPHSFIKVISGSLLETGRNPRCCGSSQVKCWRHGFKSARAQSFEPSGGKKWTMCFEIEWNNDSIW